MMTLTELAAAVALQMAALPAPSNGQIRAIPDERNIRYYTTLGLLDRPLHMRGRTALYGAKHVAQVIAIKRLQTAGKSLSEIAVMWPTLTSQQLQQISGVAFVATAESSPALPPPAKPAFWKKPHHADVTVTNSSPQMPPLPLPAPTLSASGITSTSVLRIALSNGIELTLPHSHSGIDTARLLDAAKPLLLELSRQLNQTF
jgi:DNA-binding transcriptional MerR regulator